MCADVFKKFIDKIGRRKVAAIITDNAANMKLAREELCKLDGYKHILAIRYDQHSLFVAETFVQTMMEG